MRECRLSKELHSFLPFLWYSHSDWWPYLQSTACNSTGLHQGISFWGIAIQRKVQDGSQLSKVKQHPLWLVAESLTFPPEGISQVDFSMPCRAIDFSSGGHLSQVDFASWFLHAIWIVYEPTNKKRKNWRMRGSVRLLAQNSLAEKRWLNSRIQL